MTVVHAVEHYPRFKALSFTDFLEAIARVTDHLRPTPLNVLKEQGLTASEFLLNLTDPYNPVTPREGGARSPPSLPHSVSLNVLP
jgi:hypothetical protein